MQAREKKRRKSDKKEEEEARFSLLHNRMNMCLGRRERRMAISSLLFFFPSKHLCEPAMRARCFFRRNCSFAPRLLFLAIFFVNENGSWSVVQQVGGSCMETLCLHAQKRGRAVLFCKRDSCGLPRMDFNNFSLKDLNFFIDSHQQIYYTVLIAILSKLFVDCLVNLIPFFLVDRKEVLFLAAA